MNKIHAVYAKEFAPEALLARYPNPAEYAEGKLYLFAETLEQVTNGAQKAELVKNLRGISLQPDDGEDTDPKVMRESDFIAYIQNMLSGEFKGVEVQIPPHLSNFLYATIFKPEESNEI